MLKSKIFWIALVLLMCIPVAVTFAFADDYIPILRITLSSLRYRASNLILSDVLFFGAGFFLVFGAKFAGTVLYLSWRPGWMALFVDPVFHWKLVRKVREIPAALLLGGSGNGYGNSLHLGGDHSYIMRNLANDQEYLLNYESMHSFCQKFALLIKYPIRISLIIAE